MIKKFITTNYFTQGILLFLLFSLMGSIKFTSFGVVFTLLGAIVSGLYVGVRYNRREILYSFLVTLLPNTLLQLLYFSDITKFIDTSTTVIFFISNALITALFGLLGGVISLLYRKWQTRKEDIEKKRLERKNDTYWVTRLFVSVLLFFYMFTYAIPFFIPVRAVDCSAKEQNTDTFIECYDPANKYTPSAKWVEEKPKRRMPLDGVQEYYEQNPDISQEIIDEILTTCPPSSCNTQEAINTYKNNLSNVSLNNFPGQQKGKVYLPPWKSVYPEASGYGDGLWGNTLGIFVNLYKGLKKDFWGTTKQVGKGIMQQLDQALMISSPGYALQRFAVTFRKDISAYTGNAVKNISKGKIESITDFINVPKFLKFIIDKNYNGGTKQLVKDVQMPAKITQWFADAGVVSQQTATAVKQGNIRYAAGRAAGELTGTVLMFCLPGIAKTAANKIPAIKFMGTVATDTESINVPNSPTRQIIVRNALTNHAEIRMAQRGITKDMIKVTLEKGVQYFDRDKKTFSYVLDKGFASGKTIQIAVDPATQKVVTVIERNRFNPNTVMSDGGKRWIKVNK